jgi:nucleotide-binding universal stress UspA family protein
VINISKVLFPTDFSELSETALRYAVHFARDFEATLHVIHVVDEAYQYWMNMVPSPGTPGPIATGPDEDIIASAREHLERYVAEKIGDKVSTVTQVVSGRPYLEIVTYANNQGIDLVVIGTHGHGGLTHMLLGSVAEKVVRKAPCPVLTVHHPEREFILP